MSNLPSLPVPQVDSTVQQALQALKPLVSREEEARLITAGSELISASKPLQKHLQRCAKESTNYLDSPAISSATGNVYGSLRGQTLPRNPFFILEDDPLKSFTPSQGFRASLLTVSALRFIISMRQGKLKPDTTPKGQPLTMEPYNHLFGTTLIPDGDGVNIKKTEGSRHIVVLSRGLFYKLEVLSEEGKMWFSKYELTSRFKEITRDSEEIDPLVATTNAVGTFSTEGKDHWAAARNRLHETNPEQMDTIDSALFVVCLDHEVPSGDPERVQFASHGTSRINKDGIQVGSCINRLYDKLCFVITPNSVAACSYPAAIIDGTTVLRLLGDMYTDSVLRLARHINGAHYTLWRETNTVPIKEELQKPDFERIVFDLEDHPDILAALHLAETRLADMICMHEYVFRPVSVLGKSFIRDWMQLSADSVVQACIQMAYYALYGRMVSTLEPVTTRKFADARTEPVAVQSEAMKRLCESFLSTTSDTEKWDLFSEAVSEHKYKVVSAMRGLGFERHLAALRALYHRKDEVKKSHPDLEPVPDTVPPFLFDPSVESLFQAEILAANCGNPALNMFGITPATPSGFGIGYIIKDDSISFVASSQWRQTERFLDTLEGVFKEVKLLATKANLKSVNMERRGSSVQKKPDPVIFGGYDYFDIQV